MKLYFLSIFIFLGLLFTANADLKDDALSAVGGLGAADVYITYLAIGSLADGFEKEVYSAEDADNTADVLIGFCESSKALLQKLANNPKTTANDKSTLGDIINIYNNLAKQAKALKKYIDKNDDASSQEFQDYREKAWSSISVLLKLENG